ncbi:MAG: hypothetical protein M1300_11670 [Epsilonproteobacteria bacterium]|nr:hypothetical protein [Campylobacterota bacterium]
MEIKERVKQMYGVYDDSINRAFSAVGLEETKGVVSSNEYPVFKNLSISKVKKGYFDTELIINVMVDGKPLTQTWSELVSLKGLLRYQLKLNHSPDEQYSINDTLKIQFGKKEVILNKDGIAPIALSTPEIFILIEAIDQVIAS